MVARGTGRGAGEGVPFPPRLRNIGGDVFSTHVSNAENMEETNKEQDRVK